MIKEQLENGVERRRVGLVSKGAPARQHSPILTEDGEEVAPCSGCSGCPHAPAVMFRLPARAFACAGSGCSFSAGKNRHFQASSFEQGELNFYSSCFRECSKPRRL